VRPQRKWSGQAPDPTPDPAAPPIQEGDEVLQLRVVERSSTLFLERSGPLFRVRFVELLPNGSTHEVLSKWVPREEVYADAHQLWRRWKDALFEGLGNIPI
jgi:hypothetical protein